MTQKTTFLDVYWLVKFEALHYEFSFVENFYHMFGELQAELGGSLSFYFLSDEGKAKVKEDFKDLFTLPFPKNAQLSINNSMNFKLAPHYEGECEVLLFILIWRMEQEKEKWVPKAVNTLKQFATEAESDLQIIDLNETGLQKIHDLINYK